MAYRVVWGKVVAEAYSEPWQTSKMELSGDIVNDMKPVN